MGGRIVRSIAHPVRQRKHPNNMYILRYLENVWSANRICLNLLVPKFLIREETEIYLAGGCNSLGNWKSKVKMNKITVESLS